jgi:predicted nucleic acid-binding protein
VNFLLDTNVVSERRRPRPNANVTAWLNSAPSGSLFLSVLVIGELRRGIDLLHRRDRQQAMLLEGWFHALVSEYADRVLPVTAEIAEEWGRLNVPDRLPAVDGLMAATARIHRMTFVTRDTSRLAQFDIALLNPFEPLH